MNFQQEILGIWPEPTPQEKKMRNLAKEYHDMCEAFDVRCSNPPTMREWAMMNRHAQAVRKLIIMEAERSGIDAGSMHEAIRNFHKL